MISSKEIVALLDVLRDEEKPLESASAAFGRAFARTEHFRVACAMCTMLVDGLIAAPAQRLIALFLLHDLYRSASPTGAQTASPAANSSAAPFLPFLAEQLGRAHEGSGSQVEHNLLCLLLAEPPNKDVAKRSALEIRASLAVGEPLPLPNGRELLLACAERDQHIPPLRRRGVHGTVLAGASADEAAVDPLAALAHNAALSARELSLESFEPAFVRPPPPLLALSEDELIWLVPSTEGAALLWDNSMCTENVKSTEVRELMSKAFKVRRRAQPRTTRARRRPAAGRECRACVPPHRSPRRRVLRSAAGPARSGAAAAGLDRARVGRQAGLPLRAHAQAASGARREQSGDCNRGAAQADELGADHRLFLGARQHGHLAPLDGGARRRAPPLHNQYCRTQGDARGPCRGWTRAARPLFRCCSTFFDAAGPPFSTTEPPHPLLVRRLARAALALRPPLRVRRWSTG
jgi:hypothetical protein